MGPMGNAVVPVTEGEKRLDRVRQILVPHFGVNDYLVVSGMEARRAVGRPVSSVQLKQLREVLRPPCSDGRIVEAAKLAILITQVIWVAPPI